MDEINLNVQVVEIAVANGMTMTFQVDTLTDEVWVGMDNNAMNYMFVKNDDHYMSEEAGMIMASQETYEKYIINGDFCLYQTGGGEVLSLSEAVETFGEWCDQARSIANGRKGGMVN